MGAQDVEALVFVFYFYVILHRARVGVGCMEQWPYLLACRAYVSYSPCHSRVLLLRLSFTLSFLSETMRECTARQPTPVCSGLPRSPCCASGKALTLALGKLPPFDVAHAGARTAGRFTDPM
jgi:hypothetical protein